MEGPAVSSGLPQSPSPTNVYPAAIPEAAIIESMSDQPPAAERYICIHGHFYQPPRENPWLETVETEDSAAPYHDWNERITAECYAPNGASRIVNGENQIIRIMNNYSRISFNFGPTLLELAGRECAAHLSHDPRCRSAKHAALRGSRIGVMLAWLAGMSAKA